MHLTERSGSLPSQASLLLIVYLPQNLKTFPDFFFKLTFMFRSVPTSSLSSTTSVMSHSYIREKKVVVPLEGMS